MERRIKAAALWAIRKIDYKIINPEGVKWVKVFFICDGVPDILVWSTEEKRFVRIEYHKGKGDGVYLGNTNAGWFDDIEIKTIDL